MAQYALAFDVSSWGFLGTIFNLAEVNTVSCIFTAALSLTPTPSGVNNWIVYV